MQTPYQSTAPLLQSLIGLFLHLNAHHSAVLEYYTVHDYRAALIVMPILILKELAFMSSGNLFRDVLLQLDQTAKYSHADPETIERLKHAQNILVVSIPVRMDDGLVKNIYWLLCAS